MKTLHSFNAWNSRNEQQALPFKGILDFSLGEASARLWFYSATEYNVSKSGQE